LPIIEIPLLKLTCNAAPDAKLSPKEEVIHAASVQYQFMVSIEEPNSLMIQDFYFPLVQKHGERRENPLQVN